MKRKYADPIQHTIYKDGWNDAVREFKRHVPQVRVDAEYTLHSYDAGYERLLKDVHQILNDMTT